MPSTQPNLNEAWDSLPLGPVVEFVGRGAAYLLARTCKSSCVLRVG
jgi:hypothetical protein